MKNGDVKRGFKNFRKNVTSNQNRLRQIRSCTSCKYYHEEDDSDSNEEICHNNAVTSYDMVEEGNVKFCSFWTPIWHKEEVLTYCN